MKRRAKKRAEPACTLGRSGETLDLRGTPKALRNGNKQGPSVWKTPSSRHHKLERKKGAAGRSRRGHSRREAMHNSLRPWDFEVRGPQRATRKSPMVER